MALDSIHIKTPHYLDAAFVEAVAAQEVNFDSAANEPLVLSGAAKGLVDAISRAQSEITNPDSPYHGGNRIETLSNVFSKIIVPAERALGLPAAASLSASGISFEGHRQNLAAEVESLHFANVEGVLWGVIPVQDSELRESVSFAKRNLQARFGDIGLDAVARAPAPEDAL